MRLTIRHFRVSPDDLADGLNSASLISKIAERTGASVSVQIVYPGEPVILADVLDVFPARAGRVGPPWSGSGHDEIPEVIDDLQDVVVTMVGRFPGATPCVLPLQDSWAPLAARVHVVVRMSPLGGEQDWSVKEVVAQWIHEWVSQLVKDAQPERVEGFLWGPPVAGELPRVVYVYQVQSQGPMRRTYLNGSACDGRSPMVISPLAVLGGAIISGNYVLCGQRNATIFHAENPVIRELLQNHARTLDFRAVILTTAASSEADKHTIADQVAQLALQLHAEGAIVTKEGGGNTTVDLMLTLDALERAGVRTVGVVNEMAGSHGDQAPLIMQMATVNALVSTGNVDQVVALPQGAQIIGGIGVPQILESASIELAKVHGSTNLLGMAHGGCRDA